MTLADFGYRGLDLWFYCF